MLNGCIEAYVCLFFLPSLPSPLWEALTHGEHFMNVYALVCTEFLFGLHRSGHGVNR